MSGAFDDLARTLAAPMPRRRALRLAAGFLVAAAVPGFRPRASSAGLTRAAQQCPPGGQQTCVQQFGPGLPTCCECRGGGPCYQCCKSCAAAGGKGGCAPDCPKGREACGNTCCYGNEECVDGECTSCPDDRLCGGKCCEEGAVCRNQKTGLCCVKNWRACEAGRYGVVKCCPPQDKCCLNFKTKTSVCCSARQKCADGRCLCAKGDKKCGDDCCTKKEVCSSGKCCPKGKVNCGGTCCKADDCCEKTCCEGKDRICLSGKCCPLERRLGSGKNARCCPPGTVAVAGNNCCPPTDPDCCNDDLLTVVCQAGQFCVRGVCKKL